MTLPPIQTVMLGNAAGIRIGIDPGLTGALAIVDDDRVIEAVRMPRAAGPFDKDVIHIDRLREILQRWLAEHRSDAPVFVETVGGFNRDAASIAFTFGAAVGPVHCVLRMLEARCFGVYPNTWKKHAALRGTAKKASRERVIQCYPDAYPLARKDTDIADAILIARFGPLVCPDALDTTPRRRSA